MNMGIVNARIKDLCYLRHNSTIQAHIKRDFGIVVSLKRIEEIRQSLPRLASGVEGQPSDYVEHERRILKKCSDNLLAALKKAGYEVNYER